MRHRAFIKTGLVAVAVGWLGVTSVRADAPAPPPSAAPRLFLGYPIDIVEADRCYERAFARRAFPALERLLTPDFAVSPPGRGPEGHARSMSDLRMIFGVGQPPPRTDEFRDSVRLDRVRAAGRRVSVWVRQELAFSVGGTDGSVTYYFRQDWVKMMGGWCLRRLAMADEQPVVQSLTLY